MTVVAPAAARPARSVEVRVLGPADLDEGVDLLVRGFAEEPGNLALYPDPEVRRRILETGARNVIRATLPYGTVHGATVGGALAALALWHPPGASTTSLLGLVRNLGSHLAHGTTLASALPHAGSVVLHHVPEALGLVRARSRAVRRASAGTTWHLAFLATAPEHRGAGLARRLLDRQLVRCDQDRAAVWLETTDPVNPPIYERFAFRTVAHLEDAAWLPGLWVMRRDPQPR
jgi:GNAT superfamily N-acetyltransferase